MLFPPLQNAHKLVAVQKIPFTSSCHCIRKCFKMQDGRESLHQEVFPLPLDPSHILLKAPTPPPPAQRPLAKFHQVSHPAAFLLCTCSKATVWLISACPSHRLSRIPELLLENIHEKTFHWNIATWSLKIFLKSGFLVVTVTLFSDSPLPAFHRFLRLFLSHFISLHKFPSFWGNKLTKQSLSQWMSSDIFFSLSASVYDLKRSSYEGRNAKLFWAAGHTGRVLWL